LYILRPTRTRNFLETFGVQIMLSFSKVWETCFFFPFSDDVPDICGRLRGGNVVKASLKGAACGFCKQVPLVSIDPGTSRSHRRLWPIITQCCPSESMVGECLISCHSTQNSVDFSLCICTWRATPDSAVSCDNTYLTESAHVNLAPGPLATDI
jgi:hypothetical protein